MFWGWLLESELTGCVTPVILAAANSSDWNGCLVLNRLPARLAGPVIAVPARVG